MSETTNTVTRVATTPVVVTDLQPDTTDGLVAGA